MSFTHNSSKGFKNARRVSVKITRLLRMVCKSRLVLIHVEITFFVILVLGDGPMILSIITINYTFDRIVASRRVHVLDLCLPLPSIWDLARSLAHLHAC